MSDEAHPFVPGTKVAITYRYGGIRVGVVDKAHKTGRFTLVGSPQQWRPSWDAWGNGRWEAVDTNRRGYERKTLHLWTEADDAAIEQAKRTRKAQTLDKRLRQYLGGISEASLNELRAIVEREGK